jgi:hypothetical protein
LKKFLYYEIQCNSLKNHGKNTFKNFSKIEY